MESEFFNLNHHWRKSSQWSILNREHADLIASEQHVMELFRRHCTTIWNKGREHICVSDEHAVPSILASYGLDNQTDCLGEGHHVEWPGGWHPRVWEKSEDVTLQKLGGWRHEDRGCDAEAAIASAKELFPHNAGSTTGIGVHDLGLAVSVDVLDATSGDSGTVYVSPSKAGLVTVYGLESVSDSQTRTNGTEQSIVAARVAGEVICNNSMATSASQGSNDAEGVQARDGCKGQHHANKAGQGGKSGYQRLGYQCPLFLRKVAAPAANASLALALSCQGVRLASWCR